MCVSLTNWVDFSCQVVTVSVTCVWVLGWMHVHCQKLFLACKLRTFRKTTCLCFWDLFSVIHSLIYSNMHQVFLVPRRCCAGRARIQSWMCPGARSPTAHSRLHVHTCVTRGAGYHAHGCAGWAGADESSDQLWFDVQPVLFLKHKSNNDISICNKRNHTVNTLPPESCFCSLDVVIWALAFLIIRHVIRHF